MMNSLRQRCIAVSFLFFALSPCYTMAQRSIQTLQSLLEILKARENESYEYVESLIQIQSQLHSLKTPFLLGGDKSSYFSLPEDIEYRRKEEKFSNIPNDKVYEKIGITKIWRKTKGQGVVIALIDTGIDFDHPAFKGKLAVNSYEDLNGNGKFEPWPATEIHNGISGDLNNLDDDGNGVVDDVIGYDFTEYVYPGIGDWKIIDPIPEDENGHGTAMAGIIVGEQQMDGFVGIAPEAKVLPVKVFTKEGVATDLSIAIAILYAVVQGVDCINLSYGNYYYSPIVHYAIKIALLSNIAVIASAGNDGRSDFHFPSELQEVLGIAATTIEDYRALFSNYGSGVDLCAPGENIWTTALSGKYSMVSGTSIAAAIVSASFALAKSLLSFPETLQTYEVLFLSSVDLGKPGWDPFFGNGRVSLLRVDDFPVVGSIAVTSPKHLSHYDKRITEHIPILVRFSDPLIDTVIMTIREVNSTEENTLCFYNEIVYHSLSCPSINITSFPEGEYVFTVTVKLKNGRMLQRHTLFYVVSSNPLMIDYRVFQSWKGKRNALVFYIATNLPALCKLQWRELGKQTDWNVLYSNSSLYPEQSFLVEPRESSTIEYRISLWYPNTYDTSFSYGTVEYQYQSFPENTFRREAVVLQNPLYWFTPASRKITDTLLGAILDSNLKFNNIIAIGSNKTHKYNIQQIPKDITSNLLKKTPAILTYSGNLTRLYEADSTNLFKNILWQSHSHWAGGFYDFNRDGIDEIILRENDGRYVIGTYQNQSFNTIVALPNISPVDPIFGSNFSGIPLVYCADLDMDGKTEVVFGDSDGDLMVYEVSSDFTVALDTILTTDLWNADGYLAIGNLKGLGTQHIIVGRTTFLQNNIGINTIPPLWIVEIYEATAEDTYQKIWEQVYWGARPQSPYRSGVQAFDINKDGKDELILSLYPNLYIYRYDEAAKTFLPWFYTDSSVSNTIPRTSDTNAFYVSQLRGTIRYSLREPLRQYAISGLHYWIEDNSVVVTWNRIPVPQYTVHLKREEQIVDSIVVIEPRIIFPNLERGTVYKCIVRATNAYPDSIDIYFRHRPTPIAVQFSAPQMLLIHYDYPLESITNFPLSIISLSNDTNSYIPNAIYQIGQYTIAASIPRISLGMYKISIGEFQNLYGDKTNSADFTTEYPFSIPQNPSFYITRAVYSEDEEAVLLHFSKRIQRNQNFSTEIIQTFPNVQLRQIEVYQDSILKILLSPATPLKPIGKPYYFTVTHLIAEDGDSIQPGNGNTAAIWIKDRTTKKPIIYPNPASISIDGFIHIANLPEDAYIVVQSVDGNRLTTLTRPRTEPYILWYFSIGGVQNIQPGIYILSVFGRDHTLISQSKILLLP